MVRNRSGNRMLTRPAPLRLMVGRRPEATCVLRMPSGAMHARVGRAGKAAWGCVSWADDAGIGKQDDCVHFGGIICAYMYACVCAWDFWGGEGKGGANAATGCLRGEGRE